jgi:hypothetical protein
MASLGTLNDLPVLRVAPEGAWLDGGPEGPILLPSAPGSGDLQPGQVLRVFAYREDEGRLVASLHPPRALGGEVAHLQVLSVNPAGAYLDWGLTKPLFLPWKEARHEQRRLVKPGQKVLVFLFMDEAGRMAASMRLTDFLVDEAEGFREGDQVSLVIGDRTDLGLRVIVNHRYWGMLHDGDIFGKLSRGEVREGWVKALRPDLKLSLALRPPGYAKVDTATRDLLQALKRHGGFLPLTDKSEPAKIHALLGMSKKVFKQTLGALYKARRVALEAEGIRLLGD